MPEALKGQLEAYLPQIRRVVSRIAKDEGVVDDIAQECCVRIIEKEKLWRQNHSKLAGWINTVTRNLTIDILKRDRKRQSRQVSLDEELLPPQEKDFSENDIRWVISQFKHLTPMQKKVMHLKYFEGMKTIDIAKELEISEAAVSQHSSHGLVTLKRRARSDGLMSLCLPLFKKMWSGNWGTHGTAAVILMSTKIKVLSLVVIAFTTFLFFITQNNEDDPKNDLTNRNDIQGASSASEADTESQSSLATADESDINKNDAVSDHQGSTEDNAEPVVINKLILRGNITFEGKPYPGSQVVAFCMKNENDMVWPTDPWAGQAPSGVHRFVTFVNEDGGYELSEKIPKDFEIIKLMIRSQNPTYVACHFLENHVGEQLNWDFKKPRSPNIRFTQDGKDIIHFAYMNPVRVRAYRSGQEMRRLSAVDGVQLDVLPYGEQYDRDRHQGHFTGRKNILQRWLILRGDVEVVGFYTDGGIETRIPVEDLYDGMTVDIKKSKMQSKFVLEGLPDVDGLTTYISITSRNTTRLMSYTGTAAGTSPVIVQNIPEEGVYDVKVYFNHKEFKVGGHNSFPAIKIVNNKTVTLKVGPFAKTLFNFGGIVLKKNDKIRVKITGKLFHEYFVPDVPEDVWIAASIGDNVVAEIIRGDKPGARRFKSAPNAFPVIARAKGTVDETRRVSLIFESVEKK